MKSSENSEKLEIKESKNINPTNVKNQHHCVERINNSSTITRSGRILKPPINLNFTHIHLFFEAYENTSNRFEYDKKKANMLAVIICHLMSKHPTYKQQFTQQYIINKAVKVCGDKAVQATNKGN